MSITPVEHRGTAAHRPAAGRPTPAYVRGIPAGVWQSALRKPRHGQRAAAL